MWYVCVARGVGNTPRILLRPALRVPPAHHAHRIIEGCYAMLQSIAPRLQNGATWRRKCSSGVHGCSQTHMPWCALCSAQAAPSLELPSPAAPFKPRRLARSSTEYLELHPDQCPPCVPGLCAAARVKRKLRTANCTTPTRLPRGAAQSINVPNAAISGIASQRHARGREGGGGAPTKAGDRKEIIFRRGQGRGQRDKCPCMYPLKAVAVPQGRERDPSSANADSVTQQNLLLQLGETIQRCHLSASQVPPPLAQAGPRFQKSRQRPPRA